MVVNNQKIQGFRERLEAILEALERLPGRFADIRTPQDFIAIAPTPARE